MMIETFVELRYDLQHDPKAKEWAYHNAQYAHTKEIMKLLKPGTKSPTLRIQSFDEEWRVIPGAIRFYEDRVQLRLQTWVSYMSPLTCPLGGDVLDMDMRMVFGEGMEQGRDFGISYPSMTHFRSRYLFLQKEHIHYWERVR